MQFQGETMEVRVVGKVVVFRTSQFQRFTEIDGLKIDKSGALKEFPDLKDKKDWKEITIKRFKEKIKKMKSEDERIKYVMEDLIKYGYKPLYIQKQGFRPVKI